MSGSPYRLVSHPPKTIIVYRNGDEFFPGRKTVVNQRNVATFDALLTFLTSVLEAPFGAVRHIYTPKKGRKVVDLEDLQHGERYVAAGSERFKRLDYLKITPRKPETKKKEQIQPVVHSRIIVPARSLRINKDPCIINVFTNGDIFVPPARILIPKCTLTSWENVLAMVTEKVDLRTGGVHRLFTLDGHPLQGPADLRNNQYYVAVGADKFRAHLYSHWVPCMALIRQNNIARGSRDDLSSTRKTRHAKVAFAQTRFREDLEHTARGQVKHHTDSAGLETAKLQKQVSRNPLLFSAGEGSVFNAKNKREEMVGAAEVQEDCQLKVDLPIDQMEAKEVEEEFQLGEFEHSKNMEGLQGGPRHGGLPMGHRRGDCNGIQTPGSAEPRSDARLTNTPSDEPMMSSPQRQAAGERDVSRKLGRIRSRMSCLLKARRQ